MAWWLCACRTHVCRCSVHSEAAAVTVTVTAGLPLPPPGYSLLPSCGSLQTALSAGGRWPWRGLQHRPWGILEKQSPMLQSVKYLTGDGLVREIGCAFMNDRLIRHSFYWMVSLDLTCSTIVYDKVMLLANMASLHSLYGTTIYIQQHSARETQLPKS